VVCCGDGGGEAVCGITADQALAISVSTTEREISSCHGRLHAAIAAPAQATPPANAAMNFSELAFGRRTHSQSAAARDARGAIAALQLYRC
jgi:hypothetical protein